MTRIAALPLPQLHELTALSAPECKQLQIAGSAPGTRLMENLGVWIFRNETDARLWIGLKDEHVHLEDRWLYCSTMAALPASSPAFWHGIGSEHCPGTRSAILPKGDNNPHRALKSFSDYAVNTNRMLELDKQAVRDRRWLLCFWQTSGSLRTKSILNLPEQVNWSQLHELIWHQAAWCEQHDAAGMPLDILLRMHGFKALAENGAKFDPELGIVWQNDRQR